MLKVFPRLCDPSADTNFTLLKHLFLLRLSIHLHTLHLTNSILFNELLYPLRHCPPNYNSSHLRYQLCAAALTRMVIPHTTKPVRKRKGYPPEMPVSSASSYPKYVPPYQPQPSQGIVHKELFILYHHLIHCHHLRNQELTEAPRLGMVQIVLYIGAIVYIGTIPVAGILHPLSTRDNLQLVPHPR